MNKRILFFIRLIIAVVLIQTLRFKFTAHPDSVYIFSQVGLEPFGRIGIGVLELIAGLLLLFNKTAWKGAGLTFGILSGAVMMHLTTLGIEVRGDGGVLFLTACLLVVLSVIILWSEKSKIPFLKLV